MPAPSHAAKHTFYYLLILVTLSFCAIGIGQIVFQIINSSFPDVAFIYQAAFNQDVLRFGLSAVIVTSPIYWFISRAINNELAAGGLDKESKIRKWLTYLLIFAASVTVIGFLMGILNSFLNGELTIKFVLKALSAIVISAIVFAYYLYDIRRVKFTKDKVIRIFGISFWVIILVSIVAGFFFIDSPTKVRALREDEERLNRLMNVSYQVEEYNRQNNKMPENLELIKDMVYQDNLVDPITGNRFEYKVLDNSKYQLCADFNFSNREPEGTEKYSGYYQPGWLHDAGNYCFERKVEKPVKELKEVPLPPIS